MGIYKLSLLLNERGDRCPVFILKFTFLEDKQPINISDVLQPHTLLEKLDMDVVMSSSSLPS